MSKETTVSNRTWWVLTYEKPPSRDPQTPKSVDGPHEKEPGISDGQRVQFFGTREQAEKRVRVLP